MRSTAACQASGPVDDSGGFNPFSSMMTREMADDCDAAGAGDGDDAACGACAAGANADIEAVGCELPRRITSNCLVRVVYSAIFSWMVPAIPAFPSSKNIRKKSK